MDHDGAWGVGGTERGKDKKLRSSFTVVIKLTGSYAPKIALII